jgi:hypothetical protein
MVSSLAEASPSLWVQEDIESFLTGLAEGSVRLGDQPLGQPAFNYTLQGRDGIVTVSFA